MALDLISSLPENFLLLFEIGIMIIVAAVIGYILKLFKQPLIPAYVIAGIILGPLGIGLMESNETILALSEIGVAFLLFFAGIEMNIRKLKEVGKAATVGGTIQILLLFFSGFLVSSWMGLTGKAPIYVGLIVAFSSTMIVLKLLADKKELSSLHGRIIIGILLVQDIAAIVALTVLTTEFTVISISLALLKALLFVFATYLLSKVIDPIFRTSAKSTELLLVVSISLLFLFVIGSYFADLSLIIGAFFAGVVLATSDYKTEIQGKILPLRDFFSVIFFVALGMQLSFISMNMVWLSLILLFLVIVIKPLILMMLVRSVGYSKRTSFFTGNALAQTSEFSLIIATLGLSLGFVSQELFSSLVLLTVLTMTLTTYFMKYDKKFLYAFGWPLGMLKGVGLKREELEYIPSKNKKIIIFGCHRIGSLFLKYLSKRKDQVLIVDFNPEIIKSLIKKKISCIYGDYANSEVLEKARLKDAEIVVSTIPDLEDNLHLIKKVRKINSKVVIIVTAERITEAEELYRVGADYVLLPKLITGEHGFTLAKKLLKDRRNIKKIRGEQVKHLKDVHYLLSD